jgi:hypothetical protein
VPVLPVKPDDFAGPLKVPGTDDHTALHNDWSELVVGSLIVNARGDLRGAYSLALHGEGFEVDIEGFHCAHAETIWPDAWLFNSSRPCCAGIEELRRDSRSNDLRCAWDGWRGE